MSLQVGCLVTVEEVRDHLTSTYGTDGERLGLIWIGGPCDGWRGACFNDVAAAAAYAAALDAEGGQGVYHRGTTLQSAPSHGRAEADAPGWAHSFGLDLDLRGPGHKKSNLPNTREQLDDALDAAKLPVASRWTLSGGGWYAWWQFPEPVPVTSEVAQAFKKLSDHILNVAKAEFGWQFDSVHDLSRVWRQPGTTNRKIDGAPTHCVAHADTGNRYTLPQLLACAEDVATHAPAAREGTSASDVFTDPSSPWTRDAALREVNKWLGVLRAAGPDDAVNKTLNDVAMRLGHFVPGLASEEQTRVVLRGALDENTWHTDATAGWSADATITSGLKAGMREPYKVAAADSATSLTSAVSSSVELTEAEIAATVRRLDIQRVATERIAARDESRESFLPRMLVGRGVHSLPKPDPLIEGWLYRDTLARIWGASGDYKSFVALDMACSVSTGRAWHGSAVRQGKVVYVVAEGASGAGLRYEAWIEQHQSPDPLLFWLPMAVQVLGGEWAQFTRDMTILQPALIVIDTQARATVGVEENSSKEVGMVVDALEGLRQATAACVLLIHHTGTAGDRARGSTAIKGAMNTEITVKKARGLVTVANPKQKELGESEDLTLVVTAVCESVVLLSESESSVSADGFTDPAAGWVRQPLADIEAATLANMLIDGYAGSQGVTRAQALAEFVKLEPMLDSKTVRYRKQGQVWARLERLGRLAQNPMSSGKFLFLEIPDLPLLAANPDPVEFGWPQAKAPSKETSDRVKDLETE